MPPFTIVTLLCLASLACGQALTNPDEIRLKSGFDYRLEFELQMVCIENEGHAETPAVDPSEYEAIPPEKLLGHGIQIGERRLHINNLHEYWTEFEVEENPTNALMRRGASIRPIPRSADYPNLVRQFRPAFRYRYERRDEGGSPTSYRPVSAWSEWQILPEGPQIKK